MLQSKNSRLISVGMRVAFVVLLLTALSLASVASGAGLIENRGQLDATVSHYVPGSQVSVYFTHEAVVLNVKAASGESQGDNLSVRRTLKAPRHGCAVWIRFVGANPTPVLEARQARPEQYHFFRGKDPAGWVRHVAAYDELVYHDLWPGIDLVYRLGGGGITYEIVAGPGVDLDQVAFRYEGAENVVNPATGRYRVETSTGTVVDLRPARGVGTTGRLLLEDVSAPDKAGGRSGFGGLLWSTFLGGDDGMDGGYNVVVDLFDQPVVCGYTTSEYFPATPGAWDESYGGNFLIDAFVAKFAADGGSLLWATFLGDSDTELEYPDEIGADMGIVLDGWNRPIVTGQTESGDFPTTPGAFDMYLEGFSAAFVTKLADDGSDLVWSTFLGGDDVDGSAAGRDLVRDYAGDLFVVGLAGLGLPTYLMPGMHSPNNNGGQDAFLAKLRDSDGYPEWATYFGGSAWDQANEVVLAPYGHPVFIGYTSSDNLIPTPGAYDETYNGGVDVFVAQIGNDGAALGFSTFIGGSDDDYGFSLVQDAAEDLYLTGSTASSGPYPFPTVPGAFQEAYGGGVSDAFVCKLTADGSDLSWSTFLGGGQYDWGHDLVLDAAGNPVLTGYTGSSLFPVTDGACDTTNDGNWDVFITKLTSGGWGLHLSTFLGGSGTDRAWAVDLDGDGNAVVTGETSSWVPGHEFPTTPGAYDETIAMPGIDAFVTKLDLVTPGAVTDIAVGPAHEQVFVTWNDPADADVVVVEIWRGMWHDGSGGSIYPEYDDIPSNTIPARPASRAEAVANPEWVLAGTVAAGVEEFTDDIVPRGVYYYEVFARDDAGNCGPAAAANARATNYILGDLVGGDPYDGCVRVADFGVFAGSFNKPEGSQGYNPECDIAPTYEAHSHGVPMTDNWVDVADFALFGANFNNCERFNPRDAVGEAATLSWRRIDDRTWSLWLTESAAGLQLLRLRAKLPAGIKPVVAAGAKVAGAEGEAILLSLDRNGLDAFLIVTDPAGALLEAGELIRVIVPATVDLSGAEIELYNSADERIALRLEETGETAPVLETRLGRNYPNPFNPRTAIEFSLASAELVTLAVYDAGGRLVRTLVKDRLQSGPHTYTWSGRDDAGQRIASGVYFYRLRAGEYRATGKMVMLQ